MSYSQKRIDYNNEWPDSRIEFAGQIEYKKLLLSKGVSNILRPIQLPLIPDYSFQRLLSFKIDIYEQLPDRPDIAFDLAWRTFEAYSSFFAIQNTWTTTKTHKILNKVCEDILINQFNNNANLSIAIGNLLSSIPLQATEFVVRRIFETTPNAIKSQQDKIRERVKDSLGVDLFTELENKYSPLTSESQRKAGMLLQIILSGTRVNINGQNFTLQLIDRLKFLVNGVLYTYRNERFHGDAFSPFKSSKTSIKTYAHSYYCLISAYFFISQLIFNHYPNQIDIELITEKLNDNTTRYNLVFEGHRKK